MKNKKIGIIFALLAGALWGSTGLFVNYFKNIDIVTMQTVFLRLFLAAVIMFFILLFKSKSLFKIKIKDVWLFIGNGLFSLLLFSFCYFYTISKSSMSVAAVLLYLAPAIVTIVSVFIFKEKLTLKKCVAVFLAFLGCMFVAGIFSSAQTIKGIAILTGVISAVGYAFYSIFTRLALNKNYNSLTIIFYSFLVASVGSIFFINVKSTFAGAFVNLKTGFITIALSLATAVLPYLFYTLSLKYIEGSKASIIASVEPVVAAILGVLIFKEHLNLMELIGIFLVLFAVVIINYKGKTHNKL